MQALRQLDGRSLILQYSPTFPTISDQGFCNLLILGRRRMLRSCKECVRPKAVGGGGKLE